jgi:hypothetical protein
MLVAARITKHLLIGLALVAILLLAIQLLALQQRPSPHLLSPGTCTRPGCAQAVA